MAQVTGIQAMRAAQRDVEPLRLEEIPSQMLPGSRPDATSRFPEERDGHFTLDDLRNGSRPMRAAAHASDIWPCEPRHGDMATMQAIPRAQQASRSTFFADHGLLDRYYRLDESVPASPEIRLARQRPADDHDRDGPTWRGNGFQQPRRYTDKSASMPRGTRYLSSVIEWPKTEAISVERSAPA